jgi:hypothetical protein
MQTKTNYLFHPEALGEKLAEFNKESVPGFEGKFQLIKEWIEEFVNDKIDNSNEDEIKPRFLTQIFGDILGYNMNDPKEWNLRPELKSFIGSTKADAGLGIFELLDTNKRSRVLAVVEIKGAQIKLDKSYGGKKNAVEQAFDYSRLDGAKWVIVTNFKEIRLYDSRNIRNFETFYFTDLNQEKNFLKFLYLLHKTGLIHTVQSRTERLFEINEYVSERVRRKGTKEDHIIDGLYKCFDQFEGLNFIDPNTIANLPPFTVLNEHVWHYSDFTLFTLNAEIYRLLQNVDIINGEIKITKTYQVELKRKKVNDAEIKLFKIFRSLNRCLIENVAAVRDYKAIEAKNKRPGVIGFSVRQKFHFDEKKDGIVKKIRIPHEKCACISCTFRSLDFNKALLKVKSFNWATVTSETAYGNYLCATDNFVKTYLQYKTVLKDTEGKSKKKIEYFIAQYNLQSLHNIIHTADEEQMSKILKHLREIDLEEILWNDLDPLRKEVRNVLRDIRDDKLFREIDKTVRETMSYLDRIKAHYDSGGTYYAAENYTHLLVHDLFMAYSYVNANFIIADIFFKYQNLIGEIFNGLLITHSLKNYPYRIKEFNQFMLTEAIINIDSSKLNEILKGKQIIAIESTSWAPLLESLKLFLDSFSKDGLFEKHANSLMTEQLLNNNFKDKCNRIFSNFFKVLSRLDFSDRKWEKSIGMSIINFLKAEDQLYSYHLQNLGEFLEVNGNLLDASQLIEIIVVANNGNNRRTNKYQKLLVSSCKALSKFYPESKIEHKNIVLIAIANGTSDTGQVDYNYLLSLWSVVDKINQDRIRSTLDEHLDVSFDAMLYENILRKDVYSHDYKNYFMKYVDYINKVKGKGFIGMKGNHPDYDDLHFENFALLVYLLKIPFDDIRLKRLTDLSDYESWLINPESFSYEKFNPEWLHATSNLYFLDRLKLVDHIRDPLRKYLLKNHNSDLAEAYFKFFEKE